MNQQNVEIKRSEFVTVIAWVFIALSAIAVAMSALQTVMVWLVVPAEMFRIPMSTSGQLPQLGAQFSKRATHLALADIHESIAELRFYRERLFVTVA